MHFMCTNWIEPEPVKNDVGFVNVSEVFIYFLSVGQKAASSISLQKSLWNSPETLHIFPRTLILHSGA